MKQLYLYIAIMLVSISGLSASTRKTPFELSENWVFGTSGGVSYLAMELKKDFTQASMDMNSMPDLVYSFHLYKRFSKRVDLGLQYRNSHFNGYKKYSSNVNWLMHSERFNSSGFQFIGNPIYYKTQLSMWSVDTKWNFLNIYSFKNNYLNANFYLRANIGLSFIGVEMGYSDPNDYVLSGLPQPIYEKGQGRQKQRDAYSSSSLGIGIHHQMSSRWSIFVESSLLFVSCDYLDGVHNYTLVSSSDKQLNLERVGVFDTIGLLQFGVNYQFDINLFRKKSSSRNWQLSKGNYDNEYFHDKRYNKVIPIKYPFKFRTWKAVKDK